MAIQMLIFRQDEVARNGAFGNHFGQRSFRMPLCKTPFVADSHSASVSALPEVLPQLRIRKRGGVLLSSKP
jgi:hypothetical protein